MRLLILALSLFALTVQAEDKTFSWDAPTAYVDGSPLNPLEELERYELGCGPEAGVRDDVRTWIATPSSTRVEDFGIGAWHCALRVRSITTAEQQGDWSDWSNEVNFTIAPPTRRAVAPMNLTVN